MNHMARIAIVEDDPKLRELFKDVLMAEGYEVETFVDTASFADALRSGVASNRERIARAEKELADAHEAEMVDGGAKVIPYDIALVDLGVPDIHGITLIRNSKHYVTCVAITESSDTDRGSAVDAGAKFAIERPVAIRRLAKIVKAALELYS
jgi:DNA-binding response OmpR family regulator